MHPWTIEASSPDEGTVGRNGGSVRGLKPIATWSLGAKVSAVLRSLWGGCCAVTGIGVRELLRTSHAKPWSECASSAGRVCAYNVFPLAVYLKALTIFP